MSYQPSPLDTLARSFAAAETASDEVKAAAARYVESTSETLGLQVGVLAEEAKSLKERQRSLRDGMKAGELSVDAFRREAATVRRDAEMLARRRESLGRQIEQLERVEDDPSTLRPFQVRTYAGVRQNLDHTP